MTQSVRNAGRRHAAAFVELAACCATSAMRPVEISQIGRRARRSARWRPDPAVDDAGIIEIAIVVELCP